MVAIPAVPEPRFPLGRLLGTPAALRRVPHLEIFKALCRHAAGDWGTATQLDARANNHALTAGERLFSAYVATDHTRFWIITEADRSATTIMLPEDY